MSIPKDDELPRFRTAVIALTALVSKTEAVSLNTKAAKDAARNLSQLWFRETRMSLRLVSISDEQLTDIDSEMQKLLRFTQGRSRTDNYMKSLRRVRRLVDDMEVTREVALASLLVDHPVEAAVTEFEASLIDTLERLVPSAALAYRQALSDLQDASRVSFRGTANELRSVLWDVLNRLAPDESVMADATFKLEKDQRVPTQKQKARFILASRLGDSARQTPEVTIDLIEERVGALSRAVMTRSSLSTHVVTSKNEAAQIKRYLDTVLSDLLEIS